MADDPLADVDDAAADLLLLYEVHGVQAVLITFVGNQVVVRCQNSEDVLPLCEKVVEQYAAPSGRTVN